jgi:biotin carboxyl carrier protein
LADRNGRIVSVRKTVVVDGVARAVAVDGRGDELTAKVADVEARAAEETLALGLRREGATWRVTLGDRVVAATVVRDRDTVWIAIDGEIHRCTAGDDARTGGAAGGVRTPRVTAPMPGKVLAVRVEVGQRVAAGDPLAVLEAMKMETVVVADGDATVKEVHVTAGATIEPGQVLVVLEFA